MDLQISYNWLKEYLPGLKASPEEVAEKLSLHAFSVERWHRMAEGLDPAIVVGKIGKIEAHPNADKLKLVYTSVIPDQDRGSRQLLDSRVRGNGKIVKIVCGGSNLYEGQLVAVALPGAKVRWHGEGELVELKPAEIRGVKSEGMICAANEVGLYEMFPHKDREILDLTATGAKVGQSLSKALDLDDTILEAEITTNRPDAMGVLGLAREISAIFGLKLKNSTGSRRLQPAQRRLKPATTEAVSVNIQVSKLCPRYIAVVMEGIKVAPSPWWMQRKLIASGVRPINNIVDITNYVLLEYGQPCHAFDMGKLEIAKLRNCEIIVRMAKKGEKILALDGKTYDLDERVLVIADAQKPVAIAGIMGGQDSGVHADTTRIVFEVANFDPLTVRRGEHQLALSSDSSVRFNKGLPVQLPQSAAARLIELTQQIAGGKVVQVIDHVARDFMSRTGGTRGAALRVSVRPQDIVKKIGVEISVAQMKKYLAALGFTVKGSAKKWTVTFPYWREVEADGLSDIAEEVARMYGYHRLEPTLPEGALPEDAPETQFVQEANIKEALRGVGYTELYTYSFVSKDDLSRAGFSGGAGSGFAGDALALRNPLSADLTHMRPWLGISMLKAVAQNEKAREVLKLFELSAEYHPRGVDLPEERQKLIVASTGKGKKEGQHFYEIKGIAEYLACVLRLPSFSFEKISTTSKAPWVERYHPSRVLLCKSGNDILGVVGELHPALTRAYGIEHRAAFLEWEMKALLPLVGRGKTYIPPLSYPPVKRDIAFLVEKKVEYATLEAAMRSVDPLIMVLELFDQYEGKGVPEGSLSLAFHISYASPERTLKGEEADKAHQKLTKMLEQKFEAKIRE